MTLKVSYVKKLHACEGKVDWKWKATIATVAFSQRNKGKLTFLTFASNRGEKKEKYILVIPRQVSGFTKVSG